MTMRPRAGRSGWSFCQVCPGLTRVPRGGTPRLARVLAAITSLVLMGQTAGLDSRAAPLDPVPPLAPFPIPVGPGIYLLGALQPSAAYVVETSAGLVLIDSGLRSDAGPVKSQMERLGLDWKAIRAILLTHAHWDHCGGAEHLRAETGARVHAGSGDADVLRRGGPREALYSAFAPPEEAEFHPTTIDVELRGGEVLEFGDVRFRALSLPGHTPGSVCYLMERPGFRALFAGDVISMLQGDEHSPQRIWRPLGTYSAYLPPRYRGDAGAYLESLRALKALPVPDLILPGHPRSDPVPQSPRLSAERWSEILDRGIAELTRLSDRYRADGADFLDGEPKRLQPGVLYLGDFRGRAVYALIEETNLLLVDAPGPGLRKFLEERLPVVGLKGAGPSVVLLTSTDPASTAGLGELCEWSHPTVVTPQGAVDAARRCCPPDTAVVAADRWPGREALGLTAIPLRGPGSVLTAYSCRRAGKLVLLTGAFPLGAAPDGDRRGIAGPGDSRNDAMDYLASVFRLGESKPDLWLPADPVSGRNANLYDDEWQSILEESYRSGYRLVPKAP